MTATVGTVTGTATLTVTGSTGELRTLTVRIVPYAGNPALPDISVGGTIGWSAHVEVTGDPTAPLPNALAVRWSCDTASSNPCPPVPALSSPNAPSLSFDIATLGIDTYTITAMTSTSDPAFVPGASSSVQFTTTNSGGN